ncbi:MAG: MFS transporter [Acidimicrobiales bacterium]
MESTPPVSQTPTVGKGVEAVLPEHHSRRWMVLAVVALAQLMVVLDATVVNIALPSAQHALNFSNADRQWIVTGYALSFGSLLLLGGRVADIVGRKRVFIIGLAGFAVASAIGGAATGFPMLVTARIVQGIFGALLAPTALSILTTTFVDPSERGKAFGVFGAIAGAGGAIGLLLGGFLTEYLSWRWSLYVNLVFAILAIIGASVFLDAHRGEDRHRLDIPGVVSASAAMFSLVYGFSHAETAGWSSPVTIGFLVAAVVLLVAFVLIELRVKNPLLPLRIVLDRDRGGSYLAIFISAVGMFGIFLFLTYYLQQTLGFSPVMTGVAFLPMIGVLIVMSTLSNTVLLGRVGAKPLVSIGMVLAAVGMLLLTRIGVHSSYASTVLPSLLVMGLGLGAVFAPAINMSTAGVQPEDAGVASATVNTAQQVGGSIGTALLNTLAATAATRYLVGKKATTSVIALATVHSYVVTFEISAGIFLVGALLGVSLLRRGAKPVPAEAGAVVL